MKHLFFTLAAILLLTACSNNADLGITSEPISADVMVRGGISIDAVADFAPNSHAVITADYYSTNTDIVIHGWQGLTVKAVFTNPGARPIEVAAGRIYCQTNCHNEPVVCESMYDGNCGNISNRHIKIAPHKTVCVYLTFANVFSNATSGLDVELTFWALDVNSAPVIGIQSYGGDKSIIYNK